MRYSTKERQEIDVRAWRLHAGMTQQALAEAMGAGIATVTRWDRGGQPSAPMLPRMAEVFGCTIDDLYEGAK